MCNCERGRKTRRFFVWLKYSARNPLTQNILKWRRVFSGKTRTRKSFVFIWKWFLSLGGEILSCVTESSETKWYFRMINYGKWLSPFCRCTLDEGATWQNDDKRKRDLINRDAIPLHNHIVWLPKIHHVLRHYLYLTRPIAAAHRKCTSNCFSCESLQFVPCIAFFERNSTQIRQQIKLNDCNLNRNLHRTVSERKGKREREREWDQTEPERKAREEREKIVCCVNSHEHAMPLQH